MQDSKKKRSLNQEVSRPEIWEMLRKDSSRTRNLKDVKTETSWDWAKICKTETLMIVSSITVTADWFLPFEFWQQLVYNHVI